MGEAPTVTGERRGTVRAPYRVSMLLSLGLVALFAAGMAFGAWTTHSGPNETATGTLTPAQLLAYWSFQAATPTTIPGTVPGAASSSAASPSILPSGTASYVVNTATSGHGAVEWVLLERSSAPASTEIELTLVDSTGSTPATATNTVYVETQSSVSGTTAYDFYFDAGAGTVVFDTAQETSQLCGAIGSCP